MTARLAACLACLGLLASAAAAQTPPGGGNAGAAADSSVTFMQSLEAAADTVRTLEEEILLIEELLTAERDSLLDLGKPPAVVDNHVNTRRQRLVTEATSRYNESLGISEPLFSDCTNKPEMSVKANVTKVNYGGTWTNTVRVRDGGSLNTTGSMGFDSYRRQDKTVENRSAGTTYNSGTLLPVTLSAEARTDWMEDVTTNTAGNTNLNKRQTRRAGLRASRNDILTGPVSHDVSAGWFYNDQRAINLNQRNDTDDGEISGAIRSGVTVVDGVTVATRLYGVKRDGTNLLAGLDSRASTTGDSLGAGTYYDRGPVTGSIVATQSSFDKSYLDYRRNSNGLIDTTNVPDGVSKVVQELEEKDALDLRWDNTLFVGRFRLSSQLQHTFDRQQYAQSQVGRKDRASDLVKLALTAPVGRDSFVINYTYDLRWDDQRFNGATADRGRQDKKSRDISIEWFRDLFRHTRISARYRTELYQDIAEVVDGAPFNENDRDRLTEEGRLKLEAQWPNVFTATLVGEYQTIEDIAIRGTRSANNNTKRTYEIAPSYRWFIGPKLTLSQTFRMYIQYQDYAFGYLESVNKDDTFNKRGNLATKLLWKPSERLSIDVIHDYNQKFNGTRTGGDAAGADFYRRDQDQFINRIELGMEWKATGWFRLETATYRTRDLVRRFGTTTTESTRYSGELWVGGIIDKTWGPSSRPFKVKGRVRRYLAYGPNVTDTSDDYWEADVTVNWTF
jgi:hypothetical protein